MKTPARSAKQKDVVAYCWQSGQIGIGPTIPKGALPIVWGSRRRVEKIISGTARLSRTDNETYLVPGIPEAPDGNAKLKALETYVEWIEKRKARRAA